MLKFVSSIGDAAYKTATKTGLAAGTEQPPYPCALPLPVIDDVNDVERAESLLDFAFDSIRDMLQDMQKLNASMADPALRRPWKPVEFADEGGDLRFFSRHHIGPYNFAKVTFSLTGVTPLMVLAQMHPKSLEKRKRYSCHQQQYEVIARNPQLPAEVVNGDEDAYLEQLALWGMRDWYMEYHQYYAPPPVASRDAVFLAEKRYVAQEDAYYVYGCSVNYAPYHKKTPGCVRSIVLWGWELYDVGNNTTMARYVSCMNFNGWAPTFLIGWMKSAIAKELQTARTLLYDARDAQQREKAAAEKEEQAKAQEKATKEREQQSTRNRTTSSSDEMLANVIKPAPSTASLEWISSSGTSAGHSPRRVSVSTNGSKVGSSNAGSSAEEMRVAAAAQAIVAHKVVLQKQQQPQLVAMPAPRRLCVEDPRCYSEEEEDLVIIE